MTWFIALIRPNVVLLGFEMFVCPFLWDFLRLFVLFPSPSQKNCLTFKSFENPPQKAVIIHDSGEEATWKYPQMVVEHKKVAAEWKKARNSFLTIVHRTRFVIKNSWVRHIKTSPSRLCKQAEFSVLEFIFTGTNSLEKLTSRLPTMENKS